MQIKVFGSMRVPLQILSNFAQTYSLKSRAFWLKKPCCARMSKGSKPPRKIRFRLLFPQKNSNRQMGYQKIAQRNPDRCEKNQKFYMGKSYLQIKIFGSLRVPLRILSNFAQTYSLTSRAFWLKKPCCARMSKGSKPLEKLVFDFYSLKKFQISKWGRYQKIAQRNPKTGVQKEIAHLSLGFVGLYLHCNETNISP